MNIGVVDLDRPLPPLYAGSYQQQQQQQHVSSSSSAAYHQQQAGHTPGTPAGNAHHQQQDRRFPRPPPKQPSFGDLGRAARGAAPGAEVSPPLPPLPAHNSSNHPSSPKSPGPSIPLEPPRLTSHSSASGRLFPPSPPTLVHGVAISFGGASSPSASSPGGGGSGKDDAMGGVGVGEIFNVAQYAAGGAGAGGSPGAGSVLYGGGHRQPSAGPYPAPGGGGRPGGPPPTTYGAQQYRAVSAGGGPSRLAPQHQQQHRVVSPPSSSHALQQQMSFGGGSGGGSGGSGSMASSSSAGNLAGRAAGATARSPSPAQEVTLAPPSLHATAGPSSAGGGGAPIRSHSPLSQSIPIPAQQHHGLGAGDASMIAGSNSSLVELVDGEAKYVADLEMIVRKVAGAWSRTNLPPPALDAVFRAIEAVFKANRAFGAKLGALDRNDPSPKALGDVLMSWVDELEVPYGKYAQAVHANFDAIQGVVDNRALVSILAVVSESNPPSPAVLKNAPPSAARSSAAATGGWTLDTLFLLPYLRLRYYRRLYSRLLANSQPGRSDHRILSAANDRLQALLDEMERNRVRNVMDLRDGSNRRPSSSSSSATGSAAAAGKSLVPGRPHSNASQQSAASNGMQSSTYSSQQQHQHLHSQQQQQMAPPPSARWPADVKQPLGPERDSSVSASTLGTSSQETHVSLSPFATPRGGGPDCDRDSSSSSSVGGPSIPMPLAPIDHKQSDPMTPTERSTASLNDLEVRLDTSRTTDLFKMQPRACKLQMSPATLDFYRSIKRSIDAEVAFTPTSTNVDVKHSRGHVFVLTDLFLICEHMPAEEKVAKAQEVYRNQPHRIGDGGPMPELWLCYPPLAGRHLAVVSGPMETQLIVTVMKREKFLIQVESRQAREDLLEELQSCIQFSASHAKPAAPRNAPPLPTIRTDDLVSPSASSSTSRSAPNGPYSAQASPMHAANPAMSPVLDAPPPRGASLRGPPSNGGGALAPAPVHQMQHLDISCSGSAPPTHPGFTSRPEMRPSHASDPAAVGGQYSQAPPWSAQPQGPPGADPRSMSRARSTEHMRQAYHQEPVRHHPPVPQRQHSADTYPDDPPDSPDESHRPQAGPTKITAQMRCKVFFKQSHQQWRPIGGGGLKLYHQMGTNTKQLVVEADDKARTMLISTLVLSSGVERVSKTGVAVEVSDVDGSRTHIVYMIQLRNEDSAKGLYDCLLAGSERQQ